MRGNLCYPKTDSGCEASGPTDFEKMIQSIVAELQSKSHTHTNIDVLNSITAKRVLKWDSMMQSSVNMKYILQLFLADRIRIDEMYTMLGYIVVDGGVFGMGDVKSVVDGSAFVGEPTLVIDCGAFEARSVQNVVKNDGILDGGTY